MQEIFPPRGRRASTLRQEIVRFQASLSDLSFVLFPKISFCSPVGLLPVRDAMGRPIVFIRCQNVKPGSSPCLVQDITTALKCFTESLGENEEFLIRGVVYVIDISGITTSYLKILPMEEIMRIMKNAEKIVVGRHKGFHIVNVPAAVSFLVNFCLNHVPQKLKERVRFYKNFDELDIVEKKHLPKEVGGDIPLSEMFSESRQELSFVEEFKLKFQFQSLSGK